MLSKLEFSRNNECICCLTGKQLSLQPHGTGDGTSSPPFTTYYMKRKIKLEDNISHLLNAVVFSYVCILKFLFQLNDCMRRVVYLTDEK